MTDYIFQGIQYEKVPASTMHDAIAEEWISAGGTASPIDIQSTLDGADDVAIARDIVSEWSMPEEGFCRDELVAAIARYRATYRAA